MNDRLIKDTVDKIQNESVRSAFTHMIKKGGYIHENFTPQSIWNIAKYIVYIESKLRKWEAEQW